TLLLNADGGFTYTPDADYHSPPDDEFTYEACDPGSPGQSQLCDTGTVTISISASPDTPVAVDDAYFVDEDSSLSVPSPGVLGNDSDGDNLTGNPWTGLTVTLLAGPVHEDSFTLNADGSFDYVPTANYHGSDSFDYEACDPTARCDDASVIITVDSINDDPIALPDTATTDEDTPVVIDVLGNDSDPADGDTLSVASAGAGAAFGTVVNNGGNVTYIPAAEFLSVGQVQNDTFSYTVSDGNGGTATSTVSVDISGRNDDPVAVNDTSSMGAFDAPLSIPVLTNDYDVDALDTVSIISFDTVSTNGGSITQSGDNLVYNPSGFHHPTNPDTFNYLIADGNGGADSATVSILVNDPPSAVDDIGIYSVDEDQTLNVSAPGVLGNDNEPNGDSLTVSVISGVSNGSLSLQNDGSFIYSPNPNYYGSDGFTYQICDAPSGGTCDTATVDITINSVNDPPVAGNDSATTDQTTPVVINVVLNDSDLEGSINPTAVAIDTHPLHGTAVPNGDGTITYTLTDGHFITDSFTYTVNDDQNPAATSNVATVNISITQPVLNIVKEVDPTQAGLGDTVDFLIYIWNDGPGVAYDVHLQDTLGSCFQWVGGSPSGPLGDFADGDAAVRIARAQVSNTSNCDNSNTATVSSTNAVGASDSATVTFPPAGGGSAMSPASPSISVASTGSSTEAAIAFLIPVAMLVSPFVLSWLGKVKRTSRAR
ncbi:MAG: tandem-95 repeat protein, partial [Anaerolineales bacterium]|nr:tandem-95 repeat protein [Anaerolineales bacterium]